MPPSKYGIYLSRFFKVSVCVPPFLLIDYAKLVQRFQCAKYSNAFCLPLNTFTDILRVINKSSVMPACMKNQMFLF